MTIEMKLYQIKNQMECARDSLHLHLHNFTDNYAAIAVLESAITDIDVVLADINQNDLTEPLA